MMNAFATRLMFADLYKHKPGQAFLYGITESHANMYEIDYNLHKSNATYFADFDIARAHFVCHLAAPMGDALNNNTKTKLVMDPRNPDKPARGPPNIILGGVSCQFNREVPMFAKYEIWTRVLSWDRKWTYYLSYMVKKGTVRPRSWAVPGNFGPLRKKESKPEDWEKKIYAVHMAKYVIKQGRLTVHPAIALELAGVLPTRPGGWTSDEATSVDTPLPKSTELENGEWDWVRTEQERRNGWEYAKGMAAVEGLTSMFNGGEDGAFARWGPG
jgi:hypothetical protein